MQNDWGQRTKLQRLRLEKSRGPKVFAICASLVLLALSNPAENAVGKDRLFPTTKHGRGEMRYLEDVPVAIFSGTAAEIGEQHAALLAKAGAPLMNFPKKTLCRSRGRKTMALGGDRKQTPDDASPRAISPRDGGFGDPCRNQS